MAQVITFFEEQSVGGACVLNSEVYDVSDLAQLVTEFRVYGFGGTNPISCALQDCMDSAMLPDAYWRTVASTSLSVVGRAVISGSGLLRFARVQLTVSATHSAVIAVGTIGRDST